MMKTNQYFRWIAGALLLVVAALGFGAWVSAAPSFAPTLDELPVPPDATCVLVDTTRTCELWALPGSILLPGLADPLPVWGFADSETGPALVPGPVIRAEAGETLVVVLHNTIADQQIALAFPGQEGLVPDLDGVAAGNMATYTLENLSPGAFLYEAGLTADGPRQVAMGLYGALIVGSPPEGLQEAILVFSEVDPDFNANPAGFNLLNYRPQYWLINGVTYPDTGALGVQGDSVVLLRYLNAGVEHRAIGLLGLDQQVLAANGQPLPYPRGAVTEQLPAGDTRDVMLAIPSVVDGTLFPLYNTNLSQHNNNRRLEDGSQRAAFGGVLVFLQASNGGGGPGLGPVASNLVITPSKTNGIDDEVTLTATLTDDDGNVTACEYFIDVIGGTSTACAEFAPGNPVSITETISTTVLAELSGGQHTFYLRGQDEDENWGAFGSVVLTLDKAGPEIVGLGLNPNPTNGTVSVALSGTADDRALGNSNIIAAEYSLDVNAWVSMAFSPANSPFAGLSATIPVETVGGLVEGLHTIRVQAQDDLFNWTTNPGSIDLRVDKTGPTASVSLNPNVIDLNQPLPPFVSLTGTVTDPLSNGVQSNVVNAEGFIDTVGNPGTGFALYPADGLFNSPSENVYYSIPGAQFANLPPGVHQVYVLGKDAAGNWGAAGSAAITIIGVVEDTTGPVLSNLAVSPSPTNGAETVMLTATATDTQSNVAGVIWYPGTKPPKKPNQMAAVDGAFDELSEDVVASINVRNWRPGEYLISVRAYDARGNWGSIYTITLVVTR
jgi:hypothetical protein